MKPTAPFETHSVRLPQHPAVAYLCLVRVRQYVRMIRF
jgi:hypothetical protein